MLPQVKKSYYQPPLMEAVNCTNLMKKHPKADSCSTAKMMENQPNGTSFTIVKDNSKYGIKLPTPEVKQAKAEIENLQKQRDEVQVKIDQADAERDKIDAHLNVINDTIEKFLNDGGYATGRFLGVSHELPEGVTQDDIDNLNERRDQQTDIIRALIGERHEIDQKINAAQGKVEGPQLDKNNSNVSFKVPPRPYM